VSYVIGKYEPPLPVASLAQQSKTVIRVKRSEFLVAGTVDTIAGCDAVKVKFTS
jgi:hypothetical protein